MTFMANFFSKSPSFTDLPPLKATTDVITYLEVSPANHLPIALAVLACMAWRMVTWLKAERT